MAATLRLVLVLALRVVYVLVAASITDIMDTMDTMDYSANWATYVLVVASMVVIMVECTVKLVVNWVTLERVIMVITLERVIMVIMVIMVLEDGVLEMVRIAIMVKDAGDMATVMAAGSTSILGAAFRSATATTASAITVTTTLVTATTSCKRPA